MIRHQEYLLAGVQEGLLYYANPARGVTPRVFCSAAEAVAWWERYAPTYPPVGGDGVSLVPLTPPPITAEFLWRQHRAALGGKSSVTGADLPETLAECPPGAQAAHWGMAAAVAILTGGKEPPLPAAVTPEEAARVRRSLSICSAS